MARFPFNLPWQKLRGEFTRKPRARISFDRIVRIINANATGSRDRSYFPDECSSRTSLAMANVQPAI